MADTHPEALRVFLDVQSRMTATQKLDRIREMYDAMIVMQTAEVRRLYPEAGEREVFLRVAARRLSPELMKAAYGWEPADRGD